jgi:hypothetical protein
MKNEATEQPDWSVVKEIHAIHDQGGKLDETELIVSSTSPKITIRRQYIMPDGTLHVMKNTYPDINDLTCKTDMFMLECDQ